MLIPIENHLVNPRHIATVEPANWGQEPDEKRSLRVTLASGQVLRAVGEQAAMVLAAILNWARESFAPARPEPAPPAPAPTPKPQPAAASNGKPAPARRR